MEGPKALSLRELQLSIKAALGASFPLAVWVSAEISELKVNASGHCYLELIEKGEGGRVAQAQARAVIWRSTYASLSAYFISQSGQSLTAGLKVLVKVLVNFHEVYGLSLQITDIDPSYTIGEAERERQLAIAQLKRDGVWDMNRSIGLPRPIQRLAVVSSANAAGYQDFCEELSRSGYHFEITLFDAFMQGAGAEESIISALEMIAADDESFDVVVIIRGGGSTNDLRCFDSYRLSSHVAQFPLPVLSGIGHDKDVSVVDMVAAQSLKTPTAVATFLVEMIAREFSYLESAALVLHDAATQITRSYLLRLETLMSEVGSRSREMIERERQRVEGNSSNILSFADQFLKFQLSRLEGLSTAVEMQSPDNLLRLGYAVARAASGEVLRRGEQIALGDTISVVIADAEIITEVKEIKKR